MQLRSTPACMGASVVAAPRSVRRSVVCQANQADLNASFAQLNAELENLVEGLNSTGGNVKTAPKPVSKMELSTDDGSTQTLYCDENGCVLLDKKTVQGKAAAGSLGTLLTGEGWVLGMNNAEEEAAGMSQFGGRVGGEAWDVSLTQAEVDDFILAMQSIRRTIRDMAATGSAPKGPDDKPVKVKWTTPTVRMEATCDPSAKNLDHFSLTFNIGAGRAVRATWAPATVADVLLALDAHHQFNGPQ
uniref:Uncharacterized protein n=1 Tax=Chlamydomonas leiostraca TaxID=1034604 RepID=A0A7S0X0S2_9CHLO